MGLKDIEKLKGKTPARLELEKRANRAGIPLASLLKETKGDEEEAGKLLTLIISTL